jgi:hypothetical protein
MHSNVIFSCLFHKVQIFTKNLLLLLNDFAALLGTFSRTCFHPALSLAGVLAFASIPSTSARALSFTLINPRTPDLIATGLIGSLGNERATGNQGGYRARDHNPFSKCVHPYTS